MRSMSVPRTMRESLETGHIEAVTAARQQPPPPTVQAVPERLWPFPGRLATDDRIYIDAKGWRGQPCYNGNLASL
jgi:hypothetical protein